MAHFRVSFGIAARTAGHSAAKRAAYQMCARGHGIDGIAHDFRHKASQHQGTDILTPANAPGWTRDSADLWARAARSEKRVDAQEARLLEIAIPRAVPQSLHAEFVRNALQPLADAGMVVQIDRHREQAQDGGWNDHAHGMATLRELDANTGTGFSKTKAREWNAMFRDDDARTMRAQVANRCNAFFNAHDIDVRVDARTLEAQGIDRDPEPTIPHWKFEAQRNGREQTEVVALSDWRAARAEAETAQKEAAAIKARITAEAFLDGRKSQIENELKRTVPAVYDHATKQFTALPTDLKSLTDQFKKEAEVQVARKQGAVVSALQDLESAWLDAGWKRIFGTWSEAGRRIAKLNAVATAAQADAKKAKDDLAQRINDGRDSAQAICAVNRRTIEKWQASPDTQRLQQELRENLVLAQAIKNGDKATITIINNGKPKAIQERASELQKEQKHEERRRQKSPIQKLARVTGLRPKPEFEAPSYKPF